MNVSIENNVVSIEFDVLPADAVELNKVLHGGRRRAARKLKLPMPSVHILGLRRGDDNAKIVTVNYASKRTWLRMSLEEKAKYCPETEESNWIRDVRYSLKR